MRVILVWFLCLPVAAIAQSRNIVTDKEVFGVPWTSSESELVEALGEPNGYFEISKFRKMIYYGKSHSFVLVNDQLKGYYLLEHNHSNLLNETISKNQDFDRAAITLEGKDVIGKSFSEVEALLGIEFGEPDYRASYATDFVSVELTFSSTTINNERSYRLGGINIEFEL